MEKLIVNVGSLNSQSNLNFHLSKELKVLRDSFIQGNGKIPVWDLTSIVPKNVSIAALTSFLAISKTIRDFIGQPIEVEILWQPDFQGFLADIGFIKISIEFDLYNWKGMLGGYEHNKTSPNTKIFYYDDIPQINYTDIEEIINWKDIKRQEIKHSIYFRINNIFNNKVFVEEWNKNLEAIFTITISELVVNSLLHGRSIAFVGVQRTRKGITTSVCDSGIGFYKSLIAYKEPLKEKINNSNLKALLYSSFQSKNKIGLYRAINDVILSGGYINMSSFDGEILWKSKLWDSINHFIENDTIENYNIGSSSFYFENFVANDNYSNGFFKKYDNFLVGSRITFEIPF